MAEHKSENGPDLAIGVALEAIPESGILSGHVGDEPVMLSRLDGRVQAFGARCTHLGAPLADGIVVGHEVRCPWHHARFDLQTGQAIAAPAFDPLPCWPVRVENGRVFVLAKQPVTPRSSGVPRTGTDLGFVIVGGGAGGYAAAHELRVQGFEGPVTLVSAEADQPYDRTLLTKDYLEGRFGDDSLPIARTTLDDLGVAFRGGSTATAIDAAGKTVTLADGTTLPYRRLLLATGAEPKRLDMQGADRAFAIRSLADCRHLIVALQPGARVAVIGSSFIGLEAAASIRGRGFDVTVITPELNPMAKVLGPELSRAILGVHRANGIVFHLKSEVAAIDPRHVVLKDGFRVPADVVVSGIGVSPRLDLARSAGLAVDGGVVVDGSLRTSDPDIFAVGDIACWPDRRSGKPVRIEHWAVAERQGQVAARNMLGAAEAYTAPPFFWSKHFDFSFRYLGYAERWDEIVVDGSIEARDATLRFMADGQDLAVVTIGRDTASLETEKRWEEALAGR